jgi:hypothetical protein
LSRLTTVVLAAILIVFVYLILGWFVDGYFGGNIVPDGAVPDAWAAPDSWSEWRDIMIVLSAGFIFLAAVAWLAAGAAAAFLFFTVRRLLKNNVAPAVDSMKDSLDNIRGTTEFAGETVVSPIIRVYSAVRGVRAGLGAVTSLGDRVRNRKQKGRKKK